MSKLESLLEDFENALFRLQEVLEQEKKDRIMRDSAIKRFEIVFDISWKLVKNFLEEDKGVVCRSPKDCFREAYKQDLIEYSDFWIDMTDYRNKTVHIYKEELAEEVYAILPKALSCFQKLLQNIKSQLAEKN